jgi:hypothetical protein
MVDCSSQQGPEGSPVTGCVSGVRLLENGVNVGPVRGVLSWQRAVERHRRRHQVSVSASVLPGFVGVGCGGVRAKVGVLCVSDESIVLCVQFDGVLGGEHPGF